MTRFFLLSALVMMFLSSTKPANAVWIEDIHTEPNQPTNTDSITIVASGKAGSAPVWMDNSDFRRDGTSIELDLFFTLGPYAKITSWSHSEFAGTFPAGSYDLTVRGYNYDELTGTYFLTDTYITSFNVVPGPPIEADIEIKPSTLNLQSKGKWLTCHIWLPDDYNVSDIEPNTIRLLAEPNDIYPDWLWFEGQEELAMAKFNRSKLNDILVPGDVELTLTGQLTDGTIFEGTDVIRVIDKRRQRK